MSRPHAEKSSAARAGRGGPKDGDSPAWPLFALGHFLTSCTFDTSNEGKFNALRQDSGESRVRLLERELRPEPPPVAPVRPVRSGAARTDAIPARQSAIDCPRRRVRHRRLRDPGLFGLPAGDDLGRGPRSHCSAWPGSIRSRIGSPVGAVSATGGEPCRSWRGSALIWSSAKSQSRTLEARDHAFSSLLRLRRLPSSSP